MARDSVTHDEPPKVQMVRESHSMRWVGGVRAAAVTTTVNHAVYIQRSCMYGKPTNLDCFDGRPLELPNVFSEPERFFSVFTNR